MKSDSPSQLLDALDGRGSEKEREAIRELRRRYGTEFPQQLIAHYKSARAWRVRAACVFYCLEFARVSDDAVDLAKIAITDRSKVVRYRACMVFACSLRMDVLPFLKNAIQTARGETRGDLVAAIDAIEHQNQNFFLDRGHTGMTTLNVIVV